jgi:chromosome segregation protein
LKSETDFPNSYGFDTLTPSMTRVRLDSLKLTGFKSFPDEVEMTFPSDVSAIIGPNGCGKSNVVDAILWVLGEQSPSLLRLKQMGEVVFSGASGRAPGGAAEVTLVLQSDDGNWKETDGRLEIRRRVYRSGPSEYRLNGRSARLKDVVDELLTVGLGTRDYSIIEQGRVGQVLSARPTDRRILIEEAAGVTRYKKRRHEAELKLEHTRQNLTRLDDVISEVERSLRSLKRQAGQARRHRRLQDELEDHLRQLLTQEAHQLGEQRQNLDRQRAQAQNQVAAAAAALASSEADLTQARSALETAHTEVEKARSEVADLLASRERLEAFLERSSDLIDTLRDSLQRTRHDVATLTSSRAELDDRCTSAAARLESLTEAEQQVRARVEEAGAAEVEARERLRTSDSEAEQCRQDLLRTISNLTSTRNQLGEAEREQDRLAYALTQLDQEREAVAGRRTEVAERADAAIENSQAAAVSADEVEDRRHELTAQRAELQQAATFAKQESEALGHELWELRHRLAGVERELGRHTAAVEQLVSILPAETLAGQVTDFLQPEPEFAALLDRVWHDWLELPVIRTDGLSRGQLEALAELEERIRLAVATDAEPPPTWATPEGAEPLLDRAGVTPEHLPWVARTLPRAYRCPDAGRARQLADEHPEAIFVGPDDVVWQGRTMEPPTTGTRLRGTLALRSDRQKLKVEIDETSSRADAAGDRSREATASLEGVEERLRSVDAELVRTEQERARTAALEQSLLEEKTRLKRQLESIEAEIARSRTREGELEDRHTKLEKEVAAISTRNLQLEQKLEEAGADVEARREESASAIRRLDRWQAEARLAAERVAAARTDSERLSGESTTLSERIARLTSDEQQFASELEKTEEEVVHSRTRLVEEHGLLASARDQERRIAESVEAATSLVNRLDEEVRQRREEHELAREQLHELEVEQTRLDAEWERLREVSATELHSTPEELREAEVDTESTPEALREAVEELRAKLDRLGPVNLLALQEVEELQERSTFLNEQRSDLVSALKTLDATVREIDTVCTERFVDTLEKVNTVFHETFGQLFGGGSAYLELVDPDDPLESGIDITAQPPGKKTQSVQLLSGGEKALTALSLLISLFRIKPSPVCVLDEVDAPLDDANVERLADLIHAMTDHTQFVLITHNRRTMARAEVLYGITMEEPGVSKLVSVRLEE